ncbi:MAG TPA: pyrimidine reductase family protein [Mycobacteriales bacterium]|nr:pyrimidine reductase family protein [Mycobacteriales bacterium]
MRRLYPEPADPVDLAEMYAVSGERHVRANMVATVDGAISVDGRSGGVSGPADHELFLLLRGLADVILVGAGTVTAESYGPARPTAAIREQRRARGLAEVPPVAVVTSRLSLDLGLRFFTEAVVRPLVLTTARAPAGRRSAAAELADVVVVGDDSVDLPGALAELADRGLGRVLCEGGPTLLAQLVAAGVLDELCLTISPLLVGGDAPRILKGGPVGPRPARLIHLLEADGELFARYALGSPG